MTGNIPQPNAGVKYRIITLLKGIQALVAVHRLREVVWGARFEMARTVEDVLARRTRALFLDARAAMESSPVVAILLAKELGRSDAWRERDLQQFLDLAKGYIYREE